MIYTYSLSLCLTLLIIYVFSITLTQPCVNLLLIWLVKLCIWTPWKLFVFLVHHCHQAPRCLNVFASSKKLFQQLFKSFNLSFPFIMVFVFALPCGSATSHSFGVKSPQLFTFIMVLFCRGIWWCPFIVFCNGAKLCVVYKLQWL
jgi:hypothetical protein